MSKTTLDYDRSSAQVRGSRSLWKKGLVAAVLLISFYPFDLHICQ